MRISLRALNRCRDCEATFELPLGEDLVSRCPSCNSFATEVVARSRTRPILDAAVALVVLAGIVLVLLEKFGGAHILREAGRLVHVIR